MSLTFSLNLISDAAKAVTLLEAQIAPSVVLAVTEPTAKDPRIIVDPVTEDPILIVVTEPVVPPVPILIALVPVVVTAVFILVVEDAPVAVEPSVNAVQLANAPNVAPPSIDVTTVGVVNAGDVLNTQFVDVVPVAPEAEYPVILLNAVIPAVPVPVPPCATVTAALEVKIVAVASGKVNVLSAVVGPVNLVKPLPVPP
jgi:hypothetical protein